MERPRKGRNRKRKISNVKMNGNDFNLWSKLIDLSNEQSYNRGFQDGCDRTNDRWIAVVTVVLTAVEIAIIVGEALLRFFYERCTYRNKSSMRGSMGNRASLYHFFKLV